MSLKLHLGPVGNPSSEDHRVRGQLRGGGRSTAEKERVNDMSKDRKTVSDVSILSR